VAKQFFYAEDSTKILNLQSEFSSNSEKETFLLDSSIRAWKLVVNRKSDFAGYEISGHSAYRGHLQAEGGAAKEVEEDHSSMVSKVDCKKGESPV